MYLTFDKSIYNIFILSFRGFGFITFSDPVSVDKVLTQGTHELDGKKVNHYFAQILIHKHFHDYINKK